MSGEISLNKSLFDDKVGSLETAAESIEYSMSKGESLDKTNIDPFIKDLEQVIQMLEAVDKYKRMLSEDVVEIKKVGEALQNQDEALVK